MTVPCIASAMEAYPIATACIADLCLAYTIYSGAVDAYQEYVIADHTIFRLYQFLAPASGYYDICYQIPGNFTKPANTVCITSYNAKGSYPQTLYNQDTVSNQTITNNVLLQQGLNYVQISIGSGSSYTNSAGTLVSVALNNPNYVTWTIKGYPVDTVQCPLSNLISPSIGGTESTQITYNPPSNPMNITNGLPTTYANQSTAIGLPPLPAAAVTYSEPPNYPLLGIYRFVMPNATISSSYQNGVGSFTTTRLSDYDYQIAYYSVRKPTE